MILDVRIIVVFMLLIFSSCATYEFGLLRNERLKFTIKNINKTEYEFSGISYMRCFHKGEYIEEKRDLLDELFRTSGDSNNSRFNSYKLRFINSDTLLVQGVDTLGDVKFNYKIDGKLKNGYFHLNNKYLKCIGIPFLAGGCKNEKTRIGITKDNSLFIETASDDFGAVLIIFGGSISYSYATFFKEVKKPAANNG